MSSLSQFIGGTTSKAGVVRLTDSVSSTSTTTAATPAAVKVAYDAAQSANAKIPIGGIILWSGSIASIPSGWALCDGTNGTPDLRDRFVVGAGSTYVVGDIGGLNTVALNLDQIPSHTHIWKDYSYVANGQPSAGALNLKNLQSALLNNVTTATGGGVGGVTVAHENRPPFFALAYIMRTT
jgi:microcystin-dependent protein